MLVDCDKSVEAGTQTEIAKALGKTQRFTDLHVWL